MGEALTVRTVGLYAELNPARPDVFRGSIHDAVRAGVGVDERPMIDYLRGGTALVDIMEATVDVISGHRYIPGGSSILTDGEWIWRRDLSYYVERYHLALDEEFVRHVRDSEYQVPVAGRDRLVALAGRVARDILGAA